MACREACQAARPARSAAPAPRPCSPISTGWLTSERQQDLRLHRCSAVVPCARRHAPPTSAAAAPAGPLPAACWRGGARRSRAAGGERLGQAPVDLGAGSPRGPSRSAIGADALAQALSEAGAPLRACRAAGRPARELPEHVDQRPGAVQHLAHGRRPARADQAVGVLARRQHGEAQRVAGLQQRQGPVDRPRRRALAGRVAVEAEDRLGRQPPQLARSAPRSAPCRAAPRRRPKPACGQRDHVHVAFGDDHLAARPRAARAPAARP